LLGCGGGGVPVPTSAAALHGGTEIRAPAPERRLMSTLLEPPGPICAACTTVWPSRTAEGHGRQQRRRPAPGADRADGPDRADRRGPGPTRSARVGDALRRDHRVDASERAAVQTR